MQQHNRFAFIDGLTRLYTLPKSTSNPAAPPPKATALTNLSTRQTPIPLRSPRASPSSMTSTITSDSPPLKHQSSHSQSQTPFQSQTAITDSTLTALETFITTTLSQLSPSSSSSSQSQPQPQPQTILILDTPSFLLYDHPKTSSRTLLALLLRLRALPSIHSVILSLPADGPLLAASPYSAFNPSNRSDEHENDRVATGSTPLDIESASFIIGSAYQANVVMACRGLDTGWAEDVSGVVRVSRGGAELAHGQAERTERGGEWLYYITKDGGAKVWGRRGGV